MNKLWALMLALALLLGVGTMSEEPKPIEFRSAILHEDDVHPGDITCFESMQQRSRYVKVGTIGELEGFTRTDSTPDENKILSYTFTPEDESDIIEYIRVNGSFIPAEELVETIIQTYDKYASAGSAIAVSERIDTEVQGRPAYVFAVTSDYYDPTRDPEAASADEAYAEEKESNVYQQLVTCYIAQSDTHTLCLAISLLGEDDNFHLPNAQLLDFVSRYTSAFTIAGTEE